MPSFNSCWLILTNFSANRLHSLEKIYLSPLKNSIFVLSNAGFLLACAVADSYNVGEMVLCFVILHFLVYPASNGYNSYFDKDEDSIGGLKNPPKVTKELYFVSLLLDIVGLGLSLLISIEFTVMVLIYGLVSKAYSHPSIRLKMYPITGWLAAGIFQGYFTFLLSVMAITGISFLDTFSSSLQMPAVLSSILLLGSYPMTQVYQHAEDARRGDKTISRLLGVLGTFHFTAIAFSIATFGFVYYFIRYFTELEAILFLVFLSPVLAFFGYWYLKVRKNQQQANHANTMRLNFVSSLMLNAFFVYVWIS